MAGLICKSREEILREAEEKAFAYERDFHGCCQSVLAALQDVFDQRDDDVFRAASGLAGGIGLTSESCCGGLTAGVLFLGQLCGRERGPDGSFGDKENRRFKAYKYSQYMTEKYFDEYDSCQCGEITRIKTGKTYVLAKPEQYKEFVDRGAHSHICPDVAAMAARWAAEIVLDNLKDLGLEDRVRLI
jgi:hypothetical protein